MLTRREFLESSCAVAAVSGAATLISDAGAQTSADVSGYRALVCISLGGGADSFNMLVPTDASSFRDYETRRGNLALNRSELLPLHDGDRNGRSFALHHGMRELHELYLANEVALVANTGALQGPDYRTGARRAPDLSHSHLISRWHLGTADPRSRSGWAGRAADVLAGSDWQRTLPINISLSGRNAMQIGARTLAANLPSTAYRPQSNLPVGVDFSYVNEQLAERAIGRRAQLLEKVEGRSRLMVEDVLTEELVFRTPFGPDSFSADLERVAQIIAARNQLGPRRQIFFVHFDGWDHHHRLLDSQAMMLPILSRGLAAFRSALIEHDALDDVTTFTVSEFGRSLGSNGSGSDHGWGGHQIAMGGAVRGGRIYGDYPNLAVGNPLDIGGGTFVPTTSMEEYLAEMVLWLGVRVSDLPHVLPDVSKFWSAGRGTPPLGMLA